VQAAELIKAVKGVDKLLIADAQVFDVYKLEGGKTSLAVEVILQPREKTFNDAEIEALSAKIVATAKKAVGATLRA
jgi:phenylalanyl-tRNA synthetase beta chain